MSDSFIQDRDEFINRQASEKLTIVHIECTTRLINFEDLGTGIFKRTVPNYVVSLFNCLDELIEVDSEADIMPGSWSYNPLSGELFVQLFLLTII